MEEPHNRDNQPIKPRRKKRSQIQIFKEVYLPAIIACSALLLILIFIIGSISRSIQRNKLEQQQRVDASIAASVAQAQLEQEAQALALTANELAITYDYAGAISVLDSFSGDISKFPALNEKKQQYTQAMDSLVLWNDPKQVLNLSFQLLIADPSRAFSDSTYGTSYNRNFVTVGEFSKILQQLYENNYILISLSDIVTNGQLNELYLPSGKKPLILTQTQVNYYTYMTDSDGDKLPDANADGFASRLILDAKGNLTCEMVDSSGQTVVGAYDLVPILESFIETHPDFSYKGARAILSVTGYDGIFGYRTNAAAAESFGQDYYQNEISSAINVVKALRNAGYEIACYTYGNVSYGSYSADKIREDLNKWSNEVSPILGVVDTLVYAKNSDIAGPSATYSGEKYAALQDVGFTHYLGFSTNGKPWLSVQESCVRQGRILVSGSSLTNNQSWFDGIFDPTSVLDPVRGSISN